MSSRVLVTCPVCAWTQEAPAIGPGNPMPASGMVAHLETYHNWTLWTFLAWLSEQTMGEPVLTDGERAALREVFLTRSDGGHSPDQAGETPARSAG